ncbi:hypothetical protein ACFYWX_04305 [Streptomyces sp. NPDC002888]|uniref:hypothetical protein n=1 Tax=Streptomyces sp. NPDC002888 TaxID=3364668 RepID=UPI00368B5156
MRFKRALATCALLVMSTSVAACGSDDDKGKDGAGTGASTAGASSRSDDTESDDTESELPQAADMASIAYYLNKYTSCLDLETGDRYDSNHEGSNDSWGVEEAADPAWGIKERAVCTDTSGHPITLLTAPDMKKFQTAVKKDGTEVAVGQDFAVIPVGDQAVQELAKSDLRFLTCDPDFSAPSGYTKEPALVDGCVLSDYFPS